MNNKLLQIILLFLFTGSLFSQDFKIGEKPLSVNDTLKISLSFKSFIDKFDLKNFYNKESKVFFNLNGLSLTEYYKDDNGELSSRQIEGGVQRYEDKYSTNYRFDFIYDETNDLFVFKSQDIIANLFSLKESEYFDYLNISLELEDFEFENIDTSELNKMFTFDNKGLRSPDPEYFGSEIYLTPDISIKGNQGNFVNVRNILKTNYDSELKKSIQDFQIENSRVSSGTFSPFFNYIDYDNDGTKELMLRTWTASGGNPEIDEVFTNEEKNQLFSRMSFFEVKKENDSLILKYESSIDEKAEGIDIHVQDLNNDGYKDIFTVPDVYHGKEYNRPAYYQNNDNFRPNMLYYGKSSGGFEIDSLTQSTYYKGYKYILQSDNDPELEIFGMLNDPDNGSIISKWDYNPSTLNYDLNIEQKTDFLEIFHIINYDYNKDGNMDIIVFAKSKTNNVNENKVSIVYYPKENTSLDALENTPIEIFSKVYPSSFSGEGVAMYQFKFDNKNILATLLFNNDYGNSEGEFKVKRVMKWFDLDSEMNEIQNDIFPEGYLENGPHMFLQDVDNDGDLDYASPFEATPSNIQASVLINENGKFIPKFFSNFRPQGGGNHWIDIDQDGYSELFFSEFYDGLAADSVRVKDKDLWEYSFSLFPNYQKKRNMITKVTLNDSDLDGIEDSKDNCPNNYNPNQ